jgi:FkbM family methyltransferase
MQITLNIENFPLREYYPRWGKLMQALYDNEYYYNLYPKYKKILPHIERFGREGALFYSNLVTKKDQIIKFESKEFQHPIYLRNNTSDIPTFYQICYELDYELDYDESPKIILDCGANIGLSTIFFKNKFPNSKIIAIEPEESNYQMLLRNTCKYEGVNTLKRGIWNKNTNLIVEDIGLGCWGFVVKEVENENDNTIKSISIDEIIKKNNIKYIDLLKIDIEGSEKELFELNTDKWLPYVKNIIIELHDRFKEGCNDTVFKAINEYDFNIISYQGENIFLKNNNI